MGANETITSERKLKDMAKKAIQTSTEMGYGLGKSGKSDYHFRKDVEKNLKTLGNQDTNQNKEASSGGFLSGIRGVFGSSKKPPKKGEAPKTNTAAFLDKVYKKDTPKNAQNTQIANTKQAAPKPQRIEMSPSGFGKTQSSPDAAQEPPAPDIG